MNNMFEGSDDDGHLLQHHRPSGSKCFLSSIKHVRTNKTGITSLKSGDLVSTDPSAKQNCKINNSRVFLPNWSNEAFIHCRGSFKSTDSKRCRPHVAPIDTVGPDGPHPRELKELSSVIAAALFGIFRAPLQCGDTVSLDWN